MVQWGLGWLNGPMARWVLACATMVLALIAPALWNGFPIVFYDTGGYLTRPIEATLTMGRSAFYGAFLLLGTSWHFWPNIVLQSALVIWLTLLTLRLHGLGGRPWLAAAIVAGLCVLTSLPWYTAQLMPDILLPVFVLSAALLAFHADALQRWERVALIAASAAAIASHMSILALALGVLAVLAAMRALPLLAPRSNLALPAAAVVAGVALSLSSNFAITGQFAFTPGGFNFVFSRLVQDGIVHRYLDEHCPDPTIKLCEYRAEVPHTANDWLWAEESPIYVLGGFEAFEPQARRIVLDSLMQYPAAHLKTAITSTTKQFVAFATGDALTPWNWSTEFAFERYVPSAFTAYRDTRQAAGAFDFSWINAVHVPLLALAIAALPIIIVTRAGQRIAALATLLLLALLGNAAICGVLSSPSDRYQSRLAWLAALVAAIALIERYLSRQAIPPLTAESLVPSQDEGLPAKT